MKKLVYSLAFVLIIHLTFNINNCEAQWVKVSNGINTTMNIYSLTTSNLCVFAGSDSGVYISSNWGTSWTKTSLNNKVVYSLTTLGTDIYAGTGSSGVYYSTNNGTNWTQTSLNNQTVYSLTVNGNNIIAGVSGTGVYISTNNGINWAISSLGSHTILSLAATGTNIYAGASLTGIYRSTNNGANWTQTTLNNLTIKSLAISGSYIFAGAYSILNPTGIYRSTDGGSWTSIGLSGLSVLSLVVGGNSIIAGTDSGVYTSSNNGANWFRKNQGFISVPHIEAFVILENSIFAGTQGQSVWKRDLPETIGIKNISTEIPSEYSLFQNYPNPFNPSTNIRYDLPKNGFVNLVVFNTLGRELETVVNEKQTAGTYEATWDASQYPNGVYFYRLTTDGFSETKKMILIK